MNVNEYVGEKIKKNRLKKNVTQQELAEYLKVSTQAISRYELGSRKTDNDVLFKLANYFKISINDFFPPIRMEFENDQFDKFYNLNKHLLTKDDKEHIVFMINKRKKEKEKI
mgnify:CR=1 FL=1